MVNGVLSAIGFWIFDLKYWPILAIVAAVMSLIPIFGSILSSVPIVAIALTQSFGTAVEVLRWILRIHQIEANLLNPKIIGDSAKIHPVLVVFSLLVGEHFFGLPGALLAVPMLSITQSFFLHFRQLTFGEDAPVDSFVPPPPRYSTPPPPRSAELAVRARAAQSSGPLTAGARWSHKRGGPVRLGRTRSYTRHVSSKPPSVAPSKAPSKASRPRPARPIRWPCFTPQGARRSRVGIPIGIVWIVAVLVGRSWALIARRRHHGAGRRARSCWALRFAKKTQAVASW